MLNPLSYLSKFIKSSNQKELDRVGKIVTKINNLEETIKKLSDSEFPKKTKERLRHTIFVKKALEIRFLHKRIFTPKPSF